MIRRLTSELGVNLAGVEHVLRLEDELRADAGADGAARARDAPAVDHVHRQYRRELVLWQPATPDSR